MTEPQHPGWAIWEQIRQQHRERWERAVEQCRELGLPAPPPYSPRPEDPGPEHLDRLVQMEAEAIEREKVFDYRIATWRKVGIKQVLATHSKLNGGRETVLFNVPSGTWIYDPVSASETAHQADEDPYVLLEPATREEAEAEARRKGTTLPTPERLLEICRTQEGREMGMSATPSDLERCRNRTRGS